MRKCSPAMALLFLGLLASGCSGAPQGNVDPATPMVATPVATIAPAAGANGSAQPAVAPAEPTTAATAAAVAPTVVALSLGNLTVEEYPIVAQEVDTPSHFEFNQRVAPAVLEKREAWRTPIPEERVARANDALAQFGYRLAPKGEQDGFLFDLYRGENVVKADIDAVWPISVAASGQELALAVETAGGTYLVRRDRVEPWDPSQHAAIAPVMVGDDLVSVDIAANGKDWDVRRAEQVVYTVRDKPIVVASPVKGLWSWDGHWVLEVDGQVIVDGQDLNGELGYDEIFAWQLLDGQPFYFFKQGAQVGVSYAGQTLAPRYDDVVHYECCEPAAFNVTGNGTMVWGYALRDGMWDYIEMGVYK